MIEVIITEDEIQFSHRASGRNAIVQKDNYPDIFRHPRLQITDPDAAAVVLKPVLKQFVSWLAPKVTIEIRQTFPGGVTPVDRRVLQETFLIAGARHAEVTASGEEIT